MKNKNFKLNFWFGVKVFLAAFAVSAAGNLAYSVYQTTEVADAAGAPVVNIQFGDDRGHGDPHLPYHCERGIAGMGTSTTDNDNPDCLRVDQVTSGPYTEDFRFCMDHSSGVGTCTPWASTLPPMEGVFEGGPSQFSPEYYSPIIISGVSGRGHLSGTMTARIESRSLADAGLPPGTTFQNVDFGVALFYKDSDQSFCRGNDYYPLLKWTYNGAVSPWAYGYHNDDDPGCFQIGMVANMIAPPDAEFNSTNMPVDPTELVAGQVYNNNYNILFKNKGLVWRSDRITSDPTCGSQLPDFDGATCTGVRVLTSDRWKLERTDDTGVALRHNSTAINRGDTIPYEVRQTIKFTRYKGISQCDPSGVSNYRSDYQPTGWLANVRNLFIKQAEARIPDPGDEDPPCTPWPYNYVGEEVLSIDPNTGSVWNPHITPGETATFNNLNFTAPTEPGTYDLKFKMVDMDNRSSNNPPYESGRFGTEGVIRLKVPGNPPAPIVLNCSPTGSLSNPSLRQYSLWLSGGTPFGTYEVTMSSNPEGPILAGGRVRLTQTNSYTGTANVIIDEVPPGNYTLTFSSNRLTSTCQSQLVIPQAAVVKVFYNGQENPGNINDNDSGTITWQTSSVASCTTATEVGSGSVGGETSAWTGSIAAAQLNQNQPQPGRDVGPLRSARGFYRFILNCTSSTGQSISDEVTVNFNNNPAPDPIVRVFYNGQQNPAPINDNTSGVITWQTSDVSSCNASTQVGRGTVGSEASNWAGNITPINQNQSQPGRSVGPLRSAKNWYRFMLTCTGTNGTTVSGFVLVSFNIPPEDPDATVKLFFNGQENPAPIDDNTNGTITWETTNAANCNASTVVGVPPTGSNTRAWMGEITPINVPVAQTGININGLRSAKQYYRFILDCVGTNGNQTSDDVTVYFNDVPPPTGIVKLYCLGDQDSPPPKDDTCNVSYGSAATLSWEISNVSNCVINPGNYSPPSESATGSTQTDNLTVTTTFTMSCLTVSRQTVEDSVTVRVAPRPSELSATLRCKGPSDPSYRLNSCSVRNGEIVSLEYSSPEADRCSISASVGASIGDVNPPIFGYRSTAPVTQNVRHTLNCSRGAQSAPPSHVDLILIEDPAPDPDFTLECQSPAYLVQGDSAYFQIRTTALNGFNKPVAFSNTVYPSYSNGPSISNPANQVPGNPGSVLAAVSTNINTPATNYRVTFRAEGGGVVRTRDCFFTVNPIPIPPEPINPTAQPGLCERIVIAWRHPSPAPESYRVYHSFNDNDPNGALVAQVPGTQNNYEYRVNAGELDRIHYFAVSSFSGGRESARVYTSGSGVNPCAPDLNLSDKDLISVKGKINRSFNATACNDTSDSVVLPNKALFAVNDEVTFQINVCNSDLEGTLRGGRISDTMYNVNNPDTQYTLLYKDNSLTTDPSGCANATTQPNRIDFTLADLGPRDPSTVARRCTIIFTAKLVEPNNPSSKVYRFQNMGVITGNGIQPKRFQTPPFLFSLTGVPEREETAPQQ